MGRRPAGLSLSPVSGVHTPLGAAQWKRDLALGIRGGQLPQKTEDPSSQSGWVSWPPGPGQKPAGCKSVHRNGRKTICGDAQSGDAQMNSATIPPLPPCISTLLWDGGGEAFVGCFSAQRRAGTRSGVAETGRHLLLRAAEPSPEANAPRHPPKPGGKLLPRPTLCSAPQPHLPKTPRGCTEPG